MAANLKRQLDVGTTETAIHPISPLSAATQRISDLQKSATTAVDTIPPDQHGCYQKSNSNGR